MKSIYLLSLPRSGSTLLQRSLATHPAIVTTAEPWLLIPFIYALKSRNILAEYNHDTLTQAMEDFCELLPNKKQDYFDEILEMTHRLYGQATQNHTYFLDKTPRYHLIFKELLEYYPSSKFIILWRNPLACAASMMNTWSNGKWNLRRFEVDLYAGIENLVNTYKKHNDIIYTIKFEDYITNPEKYSIEILDFLDLPRGNFDSSQFDQTKLRGRMGDPTGIKAYNKISASSLDKWPITFANPLRKQWARSYINWIGNERLSIMGYDKNELLEIVESTPSSSKYLFSDAARRSRNQAIKIIHELNIKLSK